MSNTTGKIWGTTQELISNPFMELHRIEIKPSSYCSKHEHRFKSNSFYCLHGIMIVKVWKGNGLIDETVLKPGELTTVRSGESHQFETPKLADIQLFDPSFKEGDKVVCLEAYFPEPIDALDIERETQGGSLYTNV